MKMMNELIGNITLLTPKEFIMKYDGSFALNKQSSHCKRAINGILIPKNEEQSRMLKLNLIKLLRFKMATLSSKYLLTPNNKFILNNEKTRKVVQKGGYLEGNGNISIPAKRKGNGSSKRQAKRQKIMNAQKRKWEEYVEKERKRKKIETIFERVNAEYRLKVETDFGDYFNYHTITGLIRDCPKFQVNGLVRLRGESYCDAQQYDSKICETNIKIQTIPKDEDKVPLQEQKMYGCCIGYNYLQIDPNDSPTNECVYQYLIKMYQPYIKN